MKEDNLSIFLEVIRPDGQINQNQKHFLTILEIVKNTTIVWRRIRFILTVKFTLYYCHLIMIALESIVVLFIHYSNYGQKRKPRLRFCSISAIYFLFPINNIIS